MFQFFIRHVVGIYDVRLNSPLELMAFVFHLLLNLWGSKVTFSILQTEKRTNKSYMHQLCISSCFEATNNY